MKSKTLLFLLFILTVIPFSSFTEKNNFVSQSSVYLCDSPNGKKYHFSRNCRGLSNCKHSIVKVTLSEAKKRGKTLCGWEN